MMAIIIFMFSAVIAIFLCTMICSGVETITRHLDRIASSLFSISQDIEKIRRGEKH